MIHELLVSSFKDLDDAFQEAFKIPYLRLVIGCKRSVSRDVCDSGSLLGKSNSPHSMAGRTVHAPVSSVPTRRDSSYSKVNDINILQTIMTETDIIFQQRQ